MSLIDMILPLIIMSFVVPLSDCKGGFVSPGSRSSLQQIKSNVTPPTADVRSFGAKGDGKTDDTAAIDAAQRSLPASGGVLYFPSGIYAVSGSGVVLKKSNLTLKGAGMFVSTIRRMSNAGPVVQSSGSYPGIQNVTCEDLGFDWDYPNPGRGGNPSIILYGEQVEGLSRISRCRFWKSAGFAVALSRMNNVVVEDSIFHSPGDAHGGGVYVGTNSKNVIIRRNRFLYLQNGVIVATRNAKNEVVYTADSITLTDNYFDLGWWLLKEKFKGEGSSVTYTASTLNDTKATFSNLITATRSVGHNIRVMPIKQRGSAIFTARNISDPAATFITNKVRRGDIVRSGADFAVVSSVESETSLSIEEWLTDEDRQSTNPPIDRTSYTVFGIYIGAVWNQRGNAFTSTSITSETGWWDLDGNRVTPPNGTRYEVMVPRPNYPFNADEGARNITVRDNTFKRGWSDQISIYASKTAPTNATVTGNVIEDGEDMGITLHGKNNSVTNNTIRHQGCGGIWTDADSSLIDHNIVNDNQWVNSTKISCGDIIVTAGNQNTISNNHCERFSALDRWGITLWTGSRITGPTSGNMLTNNYSVNHPDGDIALISPVKDGITNTTLKNNVGRVVNEGASGTIIVPAPTPTPGSTKY